MSSALLDPVDAHLAELDRSLRGPDKARRDIVREVRDGLADAVDAYRRAGLDPHAAARRAVRDFGPVDDVVGLYQDELAAGQGRRTALLLAIALPALMLGWDFVWRSGLAPGPPAPAAVKVLAGVQDAAVAVIAAAALAIVALTFRRTCSPRRVAAAATVATIVAVVVCGGAAIAMSLVNLDQAWGRLTAQPACMLAYAVSIAVMVQLNRSAVRTLRTLRSASETPGRPRGGGGTTHTG
ncbi:permease prefix domain 1-containing protein [Pseudonocardia lacus]|uniref:permease prefix domain 1-containing protein n=1 Tax=Pseudonocardia lacus TaxID=2835865 RepID=UPI001BDBF6A7|nr:permease prefix domain 1-containing protein [Pseudonocardia lacus]